MSRYEARDGEFLILDRVPDYEHDGDCRAHISWMEEELEEAGIDPKKDKVVFSWFTDYDEDGEEGWVTVRGPKELEKKYRDIIKY